MKSTNIISRSITCRTVYAFIVLFCFLGSIPSYAQPVIADSPCDPLYYESLSARGWLEAQREITQNQNIILKPDSVFEYTCFDRLLSELADHADEMLSETSAYGTPLGSSSMDDALERLILASLKPYYVSNFEYTNGMLGGHTAGSAIVHNIPGNIVGTAYSCDIMEKVWQAAKCINFITEEEFDGFYPFEEYATNPLDKRHLPTACTPITTNWENNLTTALTSGPWTNDVLQTYFEETTPQNCTGSSCPCDGDPIPTGVTVAGLDGGPTNYEEHICLQPACRYVPSPGGGLGGCFGR